MSFKKFSTAQSENNLNKAAGPAQAAPVTEAQEKAAKKAPSTEVPSAKS
jgi:hypothetical protein